MFIKAEREILGFDHTEIVDWFNDKWNLPNLLRDLIIFHHAPLKAKQAARTAVVIHISDVLTRAVGFGSGCDNNMLISEAEVVKSLNLSLSIIKEVLEKTDQEFVKAEELIMPN